MRYLPLEDADRRAMLDRIGVRAIDDLFAAVPQDKLLKELVNLPKAKGELEVERELASLAARNTPAGSVPFFVGCGAYRHHVPATVDHLIQRSEFLTSYTPYQPEIAQGNLQAMFEFQTQVAMLTGMDVANASMYDGSTAAAEAVLMADRLTRRRRAVVSGGVHPHYRAVIETLGRHGSFEVAALPPNPAGEGSPPPSWGRVGGIPPPGPSDLFREQAPPHKGEGDLLAAIDDKTSCVVVQYPDVFGNIMDLTPIAAAAHAKGALLVVVVSEVVALGALKSPGEMGADIVAAEGQSIGNGLNFGGPYVGLFASRDKFVRQMPGRLVGETVDAEARRSYVLTLSAREQHIRREKATSNICTNSGLCALAFTIHMTLLGEKGLRRLAAVNHANAVALAAALAKVRGVEVLQKAFFNEFTIRVPADGRNVIDALAAKGVLGGVPVARLEPERRDLHDLIVVASTEINTDEDRAAYASALREVL